MAGKPIFVKPHPIGNLLFIGNERASNPASNLGEFHYPGLTWRTNGSSSNVLIGDFGTAQSVDFVAVLSANAVNEHLFQFRMDDDLLNLQGPTPQYISPPLYFISGQPGFSNALIPGRSLYHSFLNIPSVQTRRYWLLEIQNPGGDFEASDLIMGTKIQPSRYYEQRWRTRPDHQATLSESRSGVPEIADGIMMRRKSFTLGWLTEAEWETQFQPLSLAVGKTEPVYCCFDPDPGPYRQARTYFGRIQETPAGPQNFNRFEKEFEIKSFI